MPTKVCQPRDEKEITGECYSNRNYRRKTAQRKDVEWTNKTAEEGSMREALNATRD